MSIHRFMDPLNYGNYPHSMHLLFGNRLPNFTFEQSMLMKGSLDFLGLNYYTANYAADIPVANILNVSYATNPQRLICIMISINHLDYFLPIYICNSFLFFPFGLIEQRKGVPIGPMVCNQ